MESFQIINATENLCLIHNAKEKTCLLYGDCEAKKEQTYQQGIHGELRDCTRDRGGKERYGIVIKEMEMHSQKKKLTSESNANKCTEKKNEKTRSKPSML